MLILKRVGNDIVDLLHPHAQGKGKNTRFRKRILLPEEESLILADRQPDALLWALWTGKEAAYKAIQKDQGDVASIPRLYHVQFHATEIPTDAREPGERRLRGTVATPQGAIHLETVITASYVHSIATTGSLGSDARIVWQVERMPCVNPWPAYESAYVRAAARRHLVRYLPGARPQDIEIRRAQGPHGLAPPVVYVRGQVTAIEISLSHEGAYAAYAFALFS